MSKDRLDKAYNLIVNEAYDDAREILLDLQERSSTARRWLANLERLRESADDATQPIMDTSSADDSVYDLDEGQAEEAYASDDSAYVGEPDFGTEEALEFEPEFEEDLEDDSDLFADLDVEDDELADDPSFSEFVAEAVDEDDDFGDDETLETFVADDVAAEFVAEEADHDLVPEFGSVDDFEAEAGVISEFGDFLDVADEDASDPSLDTLLVPELVTEPEYDDEFVVTPEVAEDVETMPEVNESVAAAVPSSASGEYETLTDAFTHDGRTRWEYREIVLKDWRQHMDNIEYALEQGGEKITIEDAYTQLLNENGAQGWEVISEQLLPQQYVRLLMKRPVA
jgi:hypothetical protein